MTEREREREIARKVPSNTLRFDVHVFSMEARYIRTLKALTNKKLGTFLAGLFNVKKNHFFQSKHHNPKCETKNTLRL